MEGRLVVQVWESAIFYEIYLLDEFFFPKRTPKNRLENRLSGGQGHPRSESPLNRNVAQSRGILRAGLTPDPAKSLQDKGKSVRFAARMVQFSRLRTAQTFENDGEEFVYRSARLMDSVTCAMAIYRQLLLVQSTIRLFR